MDSGITFSVDATNGASRRLTVSIDISGPFTENILELRFPRWVPGSYFIREPIQHMSELSATIDGKNSKITRIDVDGAKLSGIQEAKSVSINYRLLAAEMTCRANHLDSTHVHIMPPYTWMLPTRGIDKNRIEMDHKVILKTPDDWHTATQLKGVEGEWIAEGRDEFLDAIMESNANPMITFEVEGTRQHLKLWDSGGLPIPKEGLDRFLDAMKLVIEEHFALFGVPEWKDYWTVLHLTESGRGGLEHLRSQTSMMPRKSLQEGNEEQWRDLVSLFSHEFLHQWNVKQLRPKNFLHYELQKEVHSDLLWWFEGLTSWLGDILCLRSGAWSEEDWRKDWTRKMKRHTDRNGMEFESLQESSHDAWIHLYRPNSYSREVQISYYLEGEMAIFCLDAELRKRSKGEYGMDDVMATLYHSHKLDSNNPGITHSDIKKALVNTPGGRRLGVLLDSLVGDRQAPDVLSALKLLGLDLVSEKKTKGGWLGLNLANSPNCVKVRTHLSGSPCREQIHTGDEIIAVNGHRVRSSAELSAAVYGSIGIETKFTISREGAIKEVSITPIENPKHLVNLEGKGNRLWDAIKATKR
ncbi:MAG: hypothetical protein CMB57_01195 [Euryarchaeota archaeon]|nr:hypothetical protein [Euryarchaeota archaeon]